MQLTLGLIFLGIFVAVSDAGTEALRSAGSTSSIVKDLCSAETDVKACRQAAGKCYFKHLTGATAAECKCKDSIAGVSTIYATWVETQNAGNDKCSKGPEIEFPTVHKGPGGEKPVSFNDYLKSKNQDLSTKFRCCFGTEVGLFDNKGAPVITKWKDYAAKITDTTVLSSVNKAIDSCKTSVNTCSPRIFMDCVVKACYQSLPAP